MKKYPHGLTLNAVCAAIDDYQRHEDSVPEEGILAAFNTLLGHSDIAETLRSMERTADANMAAAQAMRDDMYHWKQRAESAEAKLEKQQPMAYRWESPVNGKICYDGIKPLGVISQPLYLRPAPAINLAELVPDEIVAGWPNDPLYVNGFNACIAEIMRNIEEAK